MLTLPGTRITATFSRGLGLLCSGAVMLMPDSSRAQSVCTNSRGEHSVDLSLCEDYLLLLC